MRLWYWAVFIGVLGHGLDKPDLDAAVTLTAASELLNSRDESSGPVR